MTKAFRLCVPVRYLFTGPVRMAVDIGGMRKPYRDRKDTFDVNDLASKNPYTQFGHWFEDAKQCDAIEEANSMCLATATREGRPSNRMVLLKSYGDPKLPAGGFVFFTNYESRKAKELESNPFASLVFYWEPLKRSVRVEGSVERIGEEQSKEYFTSRPFDSQIGAWVSRQSTVIESRDILSQKEKAMRDEFEKGEKTLEKPTFWGGYRVLPDVIEFWQGQSNRLHDRIRFRRPAENEIINPELTKQGEDGWLIERLSP